MLPAETQRYDGRAMRLALKPEAGARKELLEGVIATIRRAGIDTDGALRTKPFALEMEVVHLALIVP